jgi:hypothetical protein
MKRMWSKPGALWLLLALGALVLGGCSTTDTENMSERPWNTPKSWETGFPSNLNEGR